MVKVEAVGDPHRLLTLVNLTPFTLHAAQLPPPSPSPERMPRLTLPGAALNDGPVWVCDAIPQRNCGRFSRPFLIPGKLKRTLKARTSPRAGNDCKRNPR